MKKSFIKFLGAVALVAGLASSASAAYLQGTILFTGKAALNNAPPATTKVTAWKTSSATGNTLGKLDVADADGSFTSVDGMKASFTSPWTFTDTNISNFWSVGGFSFDLTSAVKSIAGNGFTVDATGTLKGSGYDPTPGTFSFSSQGNSVSGFFSASADSTAIPEGGAAIALLGLSLLGLEGARRRMKA